MKAVVIVLVLALMCSLGVAVNATAADPVDLSGKKGVVDPKDLKKDDPKPPKTEGNPPPPPPTSPKQ